MSMQISTSTSVTATSATAAQKRDQPFAFVFRDLRKALGSGDLEAASSEYAKLASNVPKLVANRPDGLFAQIGTALAAGDMTGAKTAYANLVKGYLSHDRGQTPTVPTQSDPAPSSPPVSSTVGLAINLTA